MSKQNHPKEQYGRKLQISSICVRSRLTPGCQWVGICQFWYLEIAPFDLSVKGAHLSRKQHHPQVVEDFEFLDEGICVPVKGAYDRANHTLEGLREQTIISPFDRFDIHELLEGVVEATGVTHGDHWLRICMRWPRIHVTSRMRLYMQEYEERRF